VATAIRYRFTRLYHCTRTTGRWLLNWRRRHVVQRYTAADTATCTREIGDNQLTGSAGQCRFLEHDKRYGPRAKELHVRCAPSKKVVTVTERQDFLDWLYQRTLPTWQQYGVDREAGGFHEKLGPDCRPITSDGKRLVVQARQIYVFSHAAICGHLDRALEDANHGFEFLIAHYRSEAGWRHSVQRDGSPLDSRRDFYDQAFVIFAMAWLFKASGNRKALEYAQETLEFLDTMLDDKVNGGYGEGFDSNGLKLRPPRRQNPHMHLLEALLALHEATGDCGYLTRAAALISLAQERFIVDGCLREYFTENLRPTPSAAGRLVEPGHHFEWVWLLHRYAELSGAPDDISDVVDLLYRFAVDHGIDPQSGGIMNHIDCEGIGIDTSRRVWPQTEALKAHAARGALVGDPEASGRLRSVLAVLMRDHLAAEGNSPGTWIEHISADGTGVIDIMPASTLYHLVLAEAEIGRMDIGERDSARTQASL
jgi:mannose/cellobiose epimerase-like protein (N-acyl-D-glucosamine 2-epimerase family)